MGRDTDVMNVKTDRIAVARKLLVFFVKGGLKGSLMQKLAAWEATSRLPHEQRPAERPKPFNRSRSCS